MKILSNYLVLNIFIIFLLAVLPTGLTQTVVRYSNFTYPEVSIQPNLTGTQPRIIDIQRYFDNKGTAIVRIARENYIARTNRCLERRILLRVIQTNGSVIPINLDNIEEIQDINYCLVGSKNPIQFYPLFDQYILVTYIHATNTFDNTTFIEKGVVIDWSGKNISTLEFGPSYLNPGTTNWNPNTNVVINVTPQKGFLHLSAVNGTYNFMWRQYTHTGNGFFNLLQNDTVENLNNHISSFQIVAFPTLNDGYAIVYANSTNDYTAPDPISAQLTAKAGVYAILLTYNQTRTSQRTILYEMTTPNITFAELHCSVDYVFIGHICIIRAQQLISNPPSIVNSTLFNATTTTVINATATTATQVFTPVNVTMVNNTAPPNITFNLFYIRIRFLSTGSVMTLNPIFNIPFNSLEILRNLPLGGYTHISREFTIQGVNIATNFNFSLYDEFDHSPNWVFPQLPILSNLYGAFLILPNNTMLVALNESTTSWRILSIDLPLLAPPPRTDTGYGNLQINSTYPSINTKDLPLNTAMINVTFFDRISFSDGNLTIYQQIGGFNVPRLLINSKTCDPSQCIPLGTYISLKILTCIFNDPGDIRGKLRLTENITTYFQELMANSGISQFFTQLMDELLIIIPTEKGRLDSNMHYQIDPSSPGSKQYLISLTIYEMRNGDRKNATALKDDLNLLIKNKAITSISFGNVSRWLDSDYGFQESMSISEFIQLHQIKFILLFVGIVLFLILFIIARIKSPKSQNFVILQIGITIFRTATVAIFTFTDAKTVPNLFLPR
ncbi:17206_t:CDS:2 [Cetraspora pellucida]|uniref:17206_t:CDS:1 n=1 Tax=Cetraspora pellucida TaxID=1433469 RepID=A0A9N9ATP1_9GLOM|nr:17206_t:CDS:2 [Cetraspora pellucida]